MRHAPVFATFTNTSPCHRQQFRYVFVRVDRHLLLAFPEEAESAGLSALTRRAALLAREVFDNELSNGRRVGKPAFQTFRMFDKSQRAALRGFAELGERSLQLALAFDTLTRRRTRRFDCTCRLGT